MGRNAEVDGTTPQVGDGGQVNIKEHRGLYT